MRLSAAWPEDVRQWLRDRSPPDEDLSPLDPETCALVLEAVRNAHAAGAAMGWEKGRQDAFSVVRQVLREDVVPALTVVLGWMEMAPGQRRLDPRVGERLRVALVRLRDVVGKNDSPMDEAHAGQRLVDNASSKTSRGPDASLR